MRKRTLYYGLVLTLLVSAFLALGAGRYGIDYAQILQAIGEKLQGKTTEATHDSILFSVRLPRIVLALLAGAGLAVAGATFQAVFANPLATPDTLGVASGAAFGAALAILLHSTGFTIQLFALAGGLAAVGLVFFVSRQHGANTSLMLILSGLVISALFTALISFIKYVADPEDILPAITFWLMGTMTGATTQSLLLGIPFIVIGLALLWGLKWKLNLLALPDDEAKALGVHVARLRFIAIASAALITAATVSLCGIIGWVGLLIPHLCRLIVGNNTANVIPTSALTGAIFLLCVDTVARSATAMEIPVSILTAILGAPLFIALLRRTAFLR